MKPIDIWHKLSNLGVEPGQESNYREVLLLNKIALVCIIAMVFFIPFEVGINGWSIVPYEVGIILIISSILLINHLKYFTFGKYYFLIVAMITVFALGVAAGGNTNNEFFQFCIMLGALMLFKKRSHYITIAVLCIGLFFLQRYLVEHVPAVIYIPESSKAAARPVFLLMMVSVLFFQVYYFKALNFKYQEELEKKNDEILSSINYAKRIQEALLPRNQYERDSLGEHFILYKPKDIVSGDFYWFQQVENYQYVAVADCTGHGVPGGFLTMLGISFLNEIKLTSKTPLTPAKILDNLRDKIISDLSQVESSNRDGMDISLIRIDRDNLKATWAGANNPLYIITSKENLEKTDKKTPVYGNLAMDIYKPDKQPIGHFTHLTPFTNNEVQLNTGDLIYLFSDGFADQFGGPNNKKIGYKKFKQLLIENAASSIENQQEVLENYLTNWKGSSNQIDDVCILGFRV